MDLRCRCLLLSPTGPGPRGGLVDDPQVAAGVVEPTTTVVGDGDDVFDTDPEPAGEVDPGFDRKAHSGDEELLLALDDVWGLVRGDPDPVSGAVNELVARSRRR